MMQGVGDFIFGGSTGKSYEDLQRQREIANVMAKKATGAPQNVGEGIAAIGNALAHRMLSKRNSQIDTRLKGEFDDQWSSALGGMGGGSPMSYGAPAGGSASVPDGDMAGYVREGLIKRGLPEHVAEGFLMNMQDESGLNPGINEANPIVPGSRGGFGLYQLTGPRRRAYEAFASERGVSPDNPDAQLDFLVQELGTTEKDAAGKIMSAGSAGEAGAAIVNHFLRPAEEHRTSRAQRYLGGASGGGAQPVNMQLVQQLTRLGGNPYATDGHQAVVQALIGQQFQNADPARALDMQYKQAQIDQMGQPKPGYAMVSPQEAQQLGLPEGTYQRGPDGKISSVGKGGQTINVNTGAPGLGKLSTDYGYTLDPQTGQPIIDPATNLPTAAPIPGSPAAREIAEAEKAAATGAGAKQQQADIVLDEIDIARDLIAGQSMTSPATGITGGLMSNISSSRAGHLRNRLDTIKANIGFDKLQSMRDASPTGGALGQVSEFENRLLQAVFGSLEQAQDDEVLSYNLNRLQDIYTRIVHEGIPPEEARELYRREASMGQPAVPALETPDFSQMSDEELERFIQENGR